MSSNKRIDTSQQENNHNKKRQKVDGSGGGMKVLASETENLDSIDRGIRRTQPSSPSFVTTENETKKRSIPPAALEASDKMIWFLTGKPASARSKYAKAFKFPTKLFYALECGEYDEIVAWTPNGCAFQVHKPKDFESKVLPIIFREAKFSSFHRKLNRWKFIKIPGQHGRTYSHPLFRRGEVSLCQRITCSNNNDSLAPFPGEIEAMMQSAKKFGNDAIPGAENSFPEQPTSTRRVDDSSLFGPQYPSVLPLSASSQIDGGLNFRASSLGSSISLRGVQQDSSAITSIADAFEARRPGISAATAPGVLGRSVPFQQAYVRLMGSQGGISSRNQTNGHGVASVDPYSRIAELEDQLVLYRQQMRGGGVPPPLYTDETGNRLLYYQKELASLNPTIDGATGNHSFGRRAGGMVPGLPTASSYMDPHQQEQLLFSINQSRMIHPNGLHHMPPPQQFSSTDHFQFLQQEGGQLGRNKENSDRALSRQIESRLEFINHKAGANIRVSSGTNGVMKNNPPAGTSDTAV